MGAASQPIELGQTRVPAISRSRVRCVHLRKVVHLPSKVTARNRQKFNLFLVSLEGLWRVACSREPWPYFSATARFMTRKTKQWLLIASGMFLLLLLLIRSIRHNPEWRAFHWSAFLAGLVSVDKGWAALALAAIYATYLVRALR